MTIILRACCFGLKIGGKSDVWYRVKEGFVEVRVRDNRSLEYTRDLSEVI